jgi:hypothetical protein
MQVLGYLVLEHVILVIALIDIVCATSVKNSERNSRPPSENLPVYGLDIREGGLGVTINYCFEAGEYSLHLLQLG